MQTSRSTFKNCKRFIYKLAAEDPKSPKDWDRN